MRIFAQSKDVAFKEGKENSKPYTHIKRSEKKIKSGKKKTDHIWKIKKTKNKRIYKIFIYI